MIPIYVLTNDKHHFLLPPFMHFFNTFWGKDQPVTIVGYGAPKFSLPDNFRFSSIAPDNYPANKWSNGLIEFINREIARPFILFLEDYWITEPVNRDCVEKCYQCIQQYPGILRIDLTNDRASRKQAKPFTDYDGVDLISTPRGTPYQMSFQCGIWNPELMLQILRPHEDPWHSELLGSKRVNNRPDLLIIGTKMRPVKYKPVYRTKRNLLMLDHLPPKHLEYIKKRGWV